MHLKIEPIPELSIELFRLLRREHFLLLHGRNKIVYEVTDGSGFTDGIKVPVDF